MLVLGCAVYGGGTKQFWAIVTRGSQASGGEGGGWSWGKSQVGAWAGLETGVGLRQILNYLYGGMQDIIKSEGQNN